MPTVLYFIKNYAIPSIVSSGIALIALNFLSAKLINQLLKKESQKYEAKLQEKAALLKTTLSIYAEEQNISHRRIDHQTANAVHHVYAGITGVSEPISRILAGSHFISDNAKPHIIFYSDWAEKGHKASKALSGSIVSHSIYFDESTYKQIAEYSSVSSDVIASFLKTIRKHLAQNTPSNDLLNIIEEERKVLQKINDEHIRPMHYELIKKFRLILGIEKVN